MGLEPHKETVFKSVDVGEGAKETQALMISLYGNLAMVSLKLRDFKACAQNCNLVLSKDPVNIKALFRRGCVRHKEGKLEEAKDDLEKLLQIEPDNAAGKKELISLNKSMKDQRVKDKAAFGAMFSKPMYEDKERELQAKLRRIEEEKAKEQDDYNRSKIERRSQGLEEQTFEEWKKQVEADKKAEEEERRKADEAKRRAQKSSSQSISSKVGSSKPKTSKPKAPISDSDDEDSDLKDVRGYKKTSDGRTTSYFSNELDEKTKSLIGDTTPKAINVSSAGDSSSTSEPLSRQDSGEYVPSSWNKAGTWEERDMSEEAKAKLTDICSSTTSGTACVKKVKSIEGDAQIVISRGKKRHIYDYNIVLDVEVNIPGENESEKASKCKAVLSFPEVSPISSYESSVSFKAPTEIAKKKFLVDDRIKELKDILVTKFKEFDAEFKTM